MLHRKVEIEKRYFRKKSPSHMTMLVLSNPGFHILRLEEVAWAPGQTKYREAVNISGYRQMAKLANI